MVMQKHCGCRERELYGFGLGVKVSYRKFLCLHDMLNDICSLGIFSGHSKRLKSFTDNF